MLCTIQNDGPGDCVELRLDLLDAIDFDAIKTFQHSINKPVIFTLRTQSHGGRFAGTVQEYQQILLKLCELTPEYIDIEYDKFIDTIPSDSKVICSYHNLENTPDLMDIYTQMQQPNVYCYKIVTTANTVIDSLKVLSFLNDHSHNQRIIAHAMGPLGTCSRILNTIYGSMLTYAGEDHAPGILGADELINIYHINNMNADTKVYGLIGDPVAQSQGHFWHNQYFQQHNMNAVYVKFHVQQEELAEFFEYAKQLHFVGLSVTMPHKNAVLSYVDNMDESVALIKAANTLMIKDKQLYATNTDGQGALQSLPNVKDKRVLLYGAGGAASAIAKVVQQHGADITVVNRTKSKAQALGEAYDFKEFQHHSNCYDIVINTLPENPETLPVIGRSDVISEQSTVMDINYYLNQSVLQQQAKSKGAHIIPGEKMFNAQAELQHAWWRL